MLNLDEYMRITCDNTIVDEMNELSVECVE